MELKDLEMSVRTANCCQLNGCMTVEEFLRLDKDTVLNWKNAGRKTWNEIAEIQAWLQKDYSLTVFHNLLHLSHQWNQLLARLNEDERKASKFLFTMDKIGYLSCWQKMS